MENLNERLRNMKELHHLIYVQSEFQKEKMKKYII